MGYGIKECVIRYDDGGATISWYIDGVLNDRERVEMNDPLYPDIKNSIDPSYRIIEHKQ